MTVVGEIRLAVNTPYHLIAFDEEEILRVNIPKDVSRKTKIHVEFWAWGNTTKTNTVYINLYIDDMIVHTWPIVNEWGKHCITDTISQVEPTENPIDTLSLRVRDPDHRGISIWNLSVKMETLDND